MNKQALIERLKSLKVGFDQTQPRVIDGDEGIMVSAEEGDGAADYYGVEGLTDCPYIDPVLEAFAERHNCYWEWQNPGVIVLAE